MNKALTVARALVGRSLEDVRRALGPGESESDGDDYEALEDLTSVQNRGRFPGTVYLRNGEVELVYVGPGALEGVTPADLEEELKGRPARLRSRAGKKASLFVHAGQGIAYSAHGDELHFVEVFKPRSLEEYEAAIYKDPGPFIR